MPLGSRSERITTINVCFHLHEHGKRIIALELETNTGRKKNITDYSAFTSEAPSEAVTENKCMACQEGEEIVGLHYIIGVSTPFAPPTFPPSRLPASRLSRLLGHC